MRASLPLVLRCLPQQQDDFFVEVDDADKMEVCRTLFGETRPPTTAAPIAPATALIAPAAPAAPAAPPFPTFPPRPPLQKQKTGIGQRHFVALSVPGRQPTGYSPTGQLLNPAPGIEYDVDDMQEWLSKFQVDHCSQCIQLFLRAFSIFIYSVSTVCNFSEIWLRKAVKWQKNRLRRKRVISL